MSARPEAARVGHIVDNTCDTDIDINFDYMLAAIRSTDQATSTFDLSSVVQLQAMRLILNECRKLCAPAAAHGGRPACAASSSPSECPNCNSSDRKDEFCDRLWETGQLEESKRELADLLEPYAGRLVCAVSDPLEEARQLRQLPTITVEGRRLLVKMIKKVTGKCSRCASRCECVNRYNVNCAEINHAMRQQDALALARVRAP